MRRAAGGDTAGGAAANITCTTVLFAATTRRTRRYSTSSAQGHVCSAREPLACCQPAPNPSDAAVSPRYRVQCQRGAGRAPPPQPPADGNPAWKVPPSDPHHRHVNVQGMQRLPSLHRHNVLRSAVAERPGLHGGHRRGRQVHRRRLRGKAPLGEGHVGERRSRGGGGGGDSSARCLGTALRKHSPPAFPAP